MPRAVCTSCGRVFLRGARLVLDPALAAAMPDDLYALVNLASL